jgi:hypothetical protein
MAGGYFGPKEVRAQMERDLPALLARMNDAAAEFASGIPGEGRVVVFVEDIAEGGGVVEGYPVRLRLRARVDATGRRPELREPETLGLFRRLAAAIQEFVRRDRGGANAYYVKVEGDEPFGGALDKAYRSLEDADDRFFVFFLKNDGSLPLADLDATLGLLRKALATAAAADRVASVYRTDETNVPAVFDAAFNSIIASPAELSKLLQGLEIEDLGRANPGVLSLKFSAKLNLSAKQFLRIVVAVLSLHSTTVSPAQLPSSDAPPKASFCNPEVFQRDRAKLLDTLGPIIKAPMASEDKLRLAGKIVDHLNDGVCAYPAMTGSPGSYIQITPADETTSGLVDQGTKQPRHGTSRRSSGPPRRSTRPAV